MIPLKDPPGYPGDEAVRKAFGRAMKQARLECGLSIEQAEAAIREGLRPDEARNKFTHLGRALGIFVRQLRERKGMTRIQLASKSGLPLRFIILVERGKLASGDDICQLTRLAFGLQYSVGQFFNELTDVDEEFAAGAR
jgi:DNA-binding XRE family transcriptional regulator